MFPDGEFTHNKGQPLIIYSMDAILKKILPPSVCSALSYLSEDKVYELRLRGTVSVNYGGAYYYLSEGGLTGDYRQALVTSPILIEEILMRAAQHSIYAVNDQICGGFLSLAGGYRIGIAGEVVMNGGEIKTVKGFGSLTLRIPHEIKGCCDRIYDKVVNRGLNCLIVSPPGLGKTTLLRDFARRLGTASPINNVLIVDERSELASMVGGKPQLDVGVNTDIICNCTKEYAFSKALRAMRPDIIITDEIFGDEDLAAVENAVRSGVRVLASVHADNMDNLICKRGFAEAVNNRLFNTYVLLGGKNIGQIAGMYGEELQSCS